MATSYYSTGSVTLTTGSAVVTGNGTGWQIALISGGNVIVQAPGNVLPIASVDSDTQITAELEWTGASGTYSYTIQRDTAYLQSLDQNSQNLSYLLSELRAGTIFKYDQSGDLAGRDLYDARPKNFGYLVTIGVTQPVFFVKASNADGDWAGPFPYGTGPVGPAPELSIGSVATLPAGANATASVSGTDGEYALNLGLPRGEVGPEGPEGPEGPQGPQGIRGVDNRGSWTDAPIYSVNDLVVDDDISGDPAVWIALSPNSNSRPRDNPANWQLFPATFTRNRDYGFFTDPVGAIRDYGTFV